MVVVGSVVLGGRVVVVVGSGIVVVGGVVLTGSVGGVAVVSRGGSVGGGGVVVVVVSTGVGTMTMGTPEWSHRATRRPSRSKIAVPGSTWRLAMSPSGTMWGTPSIIDVTSSSLRGTDVATRYWVSPSSLPASSSSRSTTATPPTSAIRSAWAVMRSEIHTVVCDSPAFRIPLVTALLDATSTTDRSAGTALADAVATVAAVRLTGLLANAAGVTVDELTVIGPSPGVMARAKMPTSVTLAAPATAAAMRNVRVGVSGGGGASSDGCRHDRSCGGGTDSTKWPA